MNGHSRGPDGGVAMTTHLSLTPAQHAALVELRDHAPQPYLRERAAGLLKVAAGASVAAVAASGLLQPRQPETLSGWIARYRAAGLAGLTIRAGRGRKPVFSPSAPRRGPRRAR
jgi:hypothetical protein